MRVDHLGGAADVARQRRAVAHGENLATADGDLAGLGVPGGEPGPDHAVSDEVVGLGAAGGEADGGQSGEGRTHGHTVSFSA